MNIYILSAIAVPIAYLLGGINGAILMSELVHHEDIRERGSGNPGFTNYKRVYGGASAWVVFIFDIFKTIVPVLLFGLLFQTLYGEWQLGCALSGLAAMFGHAFPVWYKFKGGKAFVACITTVYFVDWRAGLMLTAVFALLLLTVKYMSLASISVALLYPIAVALLGAELPVILLAIASGVLVIARHHANIGRLFRGQESKFSFKKEK